MPKICYRPKKFSKDRQEKIDKANQIIEDYKAQGYELTLRQLYYQFVSRDLIANSQKEYKNLGDVINDARLAGLVDWLAIVDRTRNLRSVGTWESPQSIIDACAYSYKINLWATQPCRIEAWIEKDALVGVLEAVCNKWRVPFFSCRGYTSQSEMWIAAQRLEHYRAIGQKPILLHLGDHDPSGIDMSRDIFDRLEEFSGAPIEVKRLALNMPQINLYSPPPNPAKLTDSRCEGYIAKFGSESWELDALEPRVISELVEAAITSNMDHDAWKKALAREDQEKKSLQYVSENWETITEDID